jgi:hypothetical protein
MLVSFFLKYTRLHTTLHICIIAKNLVCIFQRHGTFRTKFRKTVCSVRRGILPYLKYQSVCPFVLIGSSACKCVPLLDLKGGTHSLAGGGTGEPTRTTEEKAWHSVYSRRYKTTGGCVRVNIRLYQQSPFSTKVKQSNLIEFVFFYLLAVFFFSLATLYCTSFCLLSA